MSTLSRTALLEFLNYLSNKGLVSKATIAARKASVNKVLEILDENEAEDLSQLDIDELMTRFSNLKGSGYTSDSLTTYKSRVKSSIDDFLSYQKNPMNFKPNVHNVGRRASERLKTDVNQSTKNPRPEKQTMKLTEAPQALVNILPIPIRADLTIKIQGLPHDLTTAEANKIANVVRAMAAMED